MLNPETLPAGLSYLPSKQVYQVRVTNEGEVTAYTRTKSLGKALRALRAARVGLAETQLAVIDKLLGDLS